MQRSNCHNNAEQLAIRHRWALWTGLALSDDGCWRVHSWCKNTHGRIVETTLPRTRYFGVWFHQPSVWKVLMQNAAQQSASQQSPTQQTASQQSSAVQPSATTPQAKSVRSEPEQSESEQLQPQPPFAF
jgi:hypothetical protein